MGAMAYGGHRKAAVEWTEGRASAASALLLRSNTVRDKKSNDESIAPPWPPHASTCDTPTLKLECGDPIDACAIAYGPKQPHRTPDST